MAEVDCEMIQPSLYIGTQIPLTEANPCQAAANFSVFSALVKSRSTFYVSKRVQLNSG
jgi:hypothetical protein